MICKTCGCDNPGELTFCQECGSRIAPRIAPPTPYVGQESALKPFHPAAPTPPIASTAPQKTGRTCQRCRGTSDGGAMFCKFCGAPLGDLNVAPANRASIAAVPPVVAPVPAAPVPAAAPSPPSAPRLEPTSPIVAIPMQLGAEMPILGRITAVAKDGAERDSYPLRSLTDIGRSEGDILVTEDKHLSPRHARIFERQGRLFLDDLGTVNGTYLRLRQTPVPLQDQDLILLGQQVIRFEIVNQHELHGPAYQHGTQIFGTPMGKVYARLCQRGAEGMTLNVHHVRGNETVLGREIGDVVFTEDPFMSRRHAVLSREPERGGFSLSDVGSSNGTFIRIRQPMELQFGDEFRVGQQLFRVNPTEATK